MPVEFDVYDESEGRMDLTEGSNAHAVLTYLGEHPETGFTPAEIHEATNVPYGSVGPTLQRLHERDLVDHKEPYWAIGDESELAKYAGMRSTIAAIEDRHGSENPADWLSDPDAADRE